MMKQSRFPETDIYCITASQFSLGRSNVDVVRQMLEAGIKIIQYREKDFSKLQKYRECLAIRDLTVQYGACLIVNDDVDLALAVESDGVHVGQEDLPAEKARELIGDKMALGLSTHSPEQARQAQRAFEAGIIDYIGVGPLYGTNLKKEPMAPVGLGYLDYVVSHQQVPFVAIGGIKEHNIAEVVRHGASCVCLVTEIVGEADIAGKIRSIRAEMAKARK